MKSEMYPKMITTLCEIDSKTAKELLVHPFTNKVSFIVHENIANVVKLWDNFIYLVFEFKLYNFRNKVIECLLLQYRNFTIQYIEILHEKIKNTPYTIESELDVIDDNVECLWLRVQQYKELLHHQSKGTHSVIEHLLNSKVINKLTTEINIVCLQFRWTVLHRNRRLISIREQLLVSSGLLAQNWQSYTIPETSVQFNITHIKGKKGYRVFEIMHEETKTSDLYNHLYIADELCTLLDGSNSTWYKLIPGNMEEFKYTTKIMTEGKCKKLIPSFQLFTFRKQLLKLKRDCKVDHSHKIHDASWILFGKRLLEMTSEIVTTYLNIWFKHTQPLDTSTVMSQKKSKFYDLFNELDFSISKARRINVLIDLRYLNILLTSYEYILITDLWSCTDQIKGIYTLSLISTLREYCNMLLTIESFLSLNNKDDIKMILRSILEREREKIYPDTIQPNQYHTWLSDITEEYKRLEEVRIKYPKIDQKICEWVLDSSYQDITIDDQSNHQNWVQKWSDFLNSKPYPHEFVFVAECGLTKFEEVTHKGKVRQKEVVIHNTILEMRNRLIMNIKYIAVNQDFIFNNILSGNSDLMDKDSLFKSVKSSISSDNN